MALTKFEKIQLFSSVRNSDFSRVRV